jgi:hypothetical protein
MQLKLALHQARKLVMQGTLEKQAIDIQLWPTYANLSLPSKLET